MPMQSTYRRVWGGANATEPELIDRRMRDAGATAQEILEVMEIASVLGIYAVTSAAPLLREEIVNRGLAPDRFEGRRPGVARNA